jgi:hypothetical protein
MLVDDSTPRTEYDESAALGRVAVEVLTPDERLLSYAAKPKIDACKS